MKTYYSKVALISCLALLLTACGQVFTPTLSYDTALSPTPNLPVGEIQTKPATSLPTQEPEQDSAQMTQPSLSPFSSGLESLIEKAKQDLVQRLSVPIAEISLVEAREVVWPDASLGCPQLGMVYSEVQTAGYLIKLEANSWSYEYHTDTNQQVVFCEENVMKPVQKPGDIKDGDPWMR